MGSLQIGLPTVRNLSGLSGNCMACPEIGIRSIRTELSGKLERIEKIYNLRVFYQFYYNHCQFEHHFE